MPTLKLATFNINNLPRRLPVLLRWLAEAQPDVVCLQETKVIDTRFPLQAIRDAGYGVRCHGQPSWNGVAILARGQTPVETRRGLPGDPADDQSRYLEAAVHGLLVGCLYAPNGNPQPGPKFDYKLRWFERFTAHAQALHATGHPIVLAGDYNIVPSDSPVDVYNPRSWKKNALFQPQPRAQYQRLLAQGWLDALPNRHPGQPVYTFWSYLRDHWRRDAGMRLDHLLLSPAVAPRLRDAGVDRWARDLPDASDHAPTWVTLDAARA